MNCEPYRRRVFPLSLAVVSTYFNVDTILQTSGANFKMSWPDGYIAPSLRWDEGDSSFQSIAINNLLWGATAPAFGNLAYGGPNHLATITPTSVRVETGGDSGGFNVVASPIGTTWNSVNSVAPPPSIQGFFLPPFTSLTLSGKATVGGEYTPSPVPPEPGSPYGEGLFLDVQMILYGSPVEWTAGPAVNSDLRTNSAATKDLSVTWTNDSASVFNGGATVYALAQANQVMSPIPEPETYALMGLGLLGVFAAKRTKTKGNAR